MWWPWLFSHKSRPSLNSKQLKVWQISSLLAKTKKCCSWTQVHKSPLKLTNSNKRSRRSHWRRDLSWVNSPSRRLSRTSRGTTLRQPLSLISKINYIIRCSKGGRECRTSSHYSWARFPLSKRSHQRNHLPRLSSPQRGPLLASRLHRTQRSWPMSRLMIKLLPRRR